MSKTYHWCIVPQCTNTSSNNKGKVFIQVPIQIERRKQWFDSIGRDFNKMQSKTGSLFMCEDHFDLEKDMENYMEWKYTKCKKIMRKDVVPHKFECQQTDEIERTCDEAPTTRKRHKLTDLNEALDEPENVSTKNESTTTDNSEESESYEDYNTAYSEEGASNLIDTKPLGIVFKEEPLDDVDAAILDVPDLVSIDEEIIIKEEKPNIYEIGEPSNLTAASSAETPKNASLCQVCLADGADVDIFQTQFDHISVCIILELCTAIKIVQVANIPQFICKICAEQLMHCNNFRKQFEKSQNILKNTPEVSIKTETENASRFGQETNESINELIEENRKTPNNTVNNKKYIWKIFMDFCADRNYELNEHRTPQELALILKDWAVNMKKLDGTEFKETTVKTMWGVSSKMLQEKYHDDYNIAIDPMKGAVFKEARDARDATRKILQTDPSKRKMSATALRLEDLTKIINFWDENTPEGLQRKFYHIAAVELAWRSIEAVGCLIDYFAMERTYIDSPVNRIKYNPPFIKTSLGGSKNCGESKWLIRNSDSNLCAVRLFLKLMSKRGPNIKIKRLFLRPNRKWKSEVDNWYDNMPVGRNVINGWTKASAAAVGLDIKNRKITNYSNRCSL